ncbi:hypothetical protein TSUD_12340 [Trifolium subterraneum]|uniref:pectinesterase n=1 Tax=Trifolium subterraneum TaxID=3900 RepID=A0A2Z6LPJ4_TRISU|nr:hypothetical protein TSUD_12340 [Trifolium subterraneum]
MSNIVQPLGWNPWNFVGHEDHIEFSEYNNYGPGSNTSNRVKWMKQLDMQTVTKMASIDFVDNEGWINNQLF